MQNPSSFFHSTTAQQFSNSVRHFFNLPDDQPQLLRRQPRAQRQLFLDKAIRGHFIVFVQLRPRLRATHPVNLRGVIHRLGGNRFLLTRGHVNYFFNLADLQYIARL